MSIIYPVTPIDYVEGPSNPYTVSSVAIIQNNYLNLAETTHLDNFLQNETFKDRKWHVLHFYQKVQNLLFRGQLPNPQNASGIQGHSISLQHFNRGAGFEHEVHGSVS